MKCFVTLLLILTSSIYAELHVKRHQFNHKTNAITSDFSGNVWQIVDGDAWIYKNDIWSFIDSNVTKFFPTPDGKMWLTYKNYSKSTSKLIENQSIIYSDSLAFRDICFDTLGNYWAISGDGNSLLKFSNTNWEPVEINLNNAIRFYTSKDNTIYLYESNSKCFRVNNGSNWTSLSDNTNLISSSTNLKFWTDLNGTAWLAATPKDDYTDRIFYYNGEYWTIETSNDDYISVGNDIKSFLRINNDEVWFDGSHGLHRYTPSTKEVHKFSYLDGLPGDAFNGSDPSIVTINGNGTPWASLYSSQDYWRGMAFYEDLKWKHIPLENLKYYNITEVESDANGEIWIRYGTRSSSGGTGNPLNYTYYGISHISDGSFTHYSRYSDSNMTDSIESITPMPNGDIWLTIFFSNDLIQLTRNETSISPFLNSAQRLHPQISLKNNLVKFIENIPYKVSIYTINGRKIRDIFGSNHFCELNKLDIASGVYLIKIKQGLNILTDQFIIK